MTVKYKCVIVSKNISLPVESLKYKNKHRTRVKGEALPLQTTDLLHPLFLHLSFPINLHPINHHVLDRVLSKYSDALIPHPTSASNGQSGSSSSTTRSDSLPFPLLFFDSPLQNFIFSVQDLSILLPNRCKRLLQRFSYEVLHCRRLAPPAALTERDRRSNPAKDFWVFEASSFSFGV